MAAYQSFYPAPNFLPVNAGLLSGPLYPGGIAPAPQTSATISPPITAPLANGSTGYLQQAGLQQESSLTVLLPINPNLMGAREMIPDLLLKGSYQTKAFVDQCHSHGIFISAGSGDNKVVLDLSGPAGKEAELIQVAMQLLTQPRVDAPTFHKLKQDNIEALQKEESVPQVPLATATNKAFYGQNHPYALSGKELIQELTPLTPEGVLAVYRQVITAPQRSKILMVSSQPVEVQQALLNQGIQQTAWYAAPYAQTPMPSVPPLFPGHGAAGPILVPNNTVERAHIFRKWRAPAFGEPDYPAFCLLKSILGGMTTHSFFRILRTENGLVYSTQQSYTSHSEGGCYQVMAEVDYDKLGAALQGMDQVIQETLNQPLMDDDLEMVKREYLLGLRSDMQDADGIAGLSLPWISNDLPPKHPSDLEAAIKRVTAADVKRVAARIFNLQTGYQVTGITAPAPVLAQWFPQQTAPLQRPPQPR